MKGTQAIRKIERLINKLRDTHLDCCSVMDSRILKQGSLDITAFDEIDTTLNRRLTELKNRIK